VLLGDLRRGKTNSSLWKRRREDELDDLEADVYSKVDSDEDSEVGDVGIVKYVFSLSWKGRWEVFLLKVAEM
jgi:hypothetical protein